MQLRLELARVCSFFTKLFFLFSTMVRKHGCRYIDVRRYTMRCSTLHTVNQKPYNVQLGALYTVKYSFVRLLLESRVSPLLYQNLKCNITTLISLKRFKVTVSRDFLAICRNICFRGDIREISDAAQTNTRGVKLYTH